MKHNWEYKKWDAVLQIINGRNQKAVENPNGKYPIYGSGGIMSYADDYLCPENCTIIGRKGSINNPIYVKSKFWNVDTAFGLCANQECVLPRYLYFFCVHYDFMKHNKATTLPSLVKADLLKIMMPIPPIEVQEQIVAELDKLNEMIATRKEQLKELDNLAQSLFYETFGDPIANPKGWETEQFEKCITKLKYPTKLQTSDYRLYGQYPIISQDDSLISGYTDREDCIFNINSPIVIFGDHTRVLKYIPFSFALGADGVKILYPSSIILARYLFFCILLSKIPSLGYSRHYKLLKELQIPIPPLPLQQQFASQVEAIEKQKEIVEASIVELQTLLDSRMDYWFN